MIDLTELTEIAMASSFALGDARLMDEAESA